MPRQYWCGIMSSKILIFALKQLLFKTSSLKLQHLLGKLSNYCLSLVNNSKNVRIKVIIKNKNYEN